MIYVTPRHALAGVHCTTTSSDAVIDAGVKAAHSAKKRSG